MSENIGNDSISERFLYSPLRALDLMLDLGGIPRRLFRIFYPIWKVRVIGHQRVATNFEEIEWFLERGIAEAGLQTVEELSQFFGLQRRFVGKLIDILKGFGHIIENSSGIHLSPIGEESVKAKVRYEELTTSAVLYFDGLGGRPLTRDHFKIPVLHTLPLTTKAQFHAIPPFDTFDSNMIQKAMQSSDRNQFGIADEVTKFELEDKEIAYIPIFIVESEPEQSAHLPRFLVFSSITDKRDGILEDAVNNEVIFITTLHLDSSEKIDNFLGEYLNNRFGLEGEQWNLEINTPLGIKLHVNAKAIHQPRRNQDESSYQRPLSVRDVGQYLLIKDWCVWVTCDDEKIRHQAAIDNLLEWLQGSVRNPDSIELSKRILLAKTRLQTEEISLEEIKHLAKKRGYARALERIEELSTV